MYGYTRQAYYKRRVKMKRDAEREEQIASYILAVRKRQPRVGGKKLHKMINAAEEISFPVGRDYLFEILRERGLLIEAKKSRVKTTQSNHRFRKHGNLIKDKQDIEAEEVLVSDITYIDTEEDYAYLFLVTDYATRRILGYNLSRDLKAESSVKALQMAIENMRNPQKAVHHSDRGFQYCCHKYTSLLEGNDMLISMTEEDHVYENALAERVNGILKQEFMLGERLPSYKIAKKMVDESVYIYNNERLHTSLNYQTPMAFYEEKSIKYAEKKCQLF